MRKCGLILVALSCMLTESAMAKDFDVKMELQRASNSDAFFETDMPILKSNVYLDRKSTLDIHIGLHKDLMDSESETIIHDERMDSVGARGWNITSYGAGDSASYDNNAKMLEIIDSYMNTSRESISASDSVEIASQYVHNELKATFFMSADESMKPFHIRFINYQDYWNDIVTGYYVIYSKIYKKYVIIGAGSKMRVFVGANGDVIGYRYDLPRLEEQKKVRTVSKDEFKDRVNKVCSYYNFDCANVSPERFECGIYDYGALNRYDNDVQVLQPACYIQYNSVPDDSKSDGVKLYVPLAISDSIVPDQNWLESLIILDIQPQQNNFSPKDNEL